MTREEPCTPETILARLRALKRYSVGDGDDGDGYRYQYQDERKDGEWICVGQLGDVIQWIEASVKDGKGGAL
jgi:hypothetical protein